MNWESPTSMQTNEPLIKISWANLKPGLMSPSWLLPIAATSLLVTALGRWNRVRPLATTVVVVALVLVVVAHNGGKG